MIIKDLKDGDKRNTGDKKQKLTTLVVSAIGPLIVVLSFFLILPAAVTAKGAGNENLPIAETPTLNSTANLNPRFESTATPDEYRAGPIKWNNPNASIGNTASPTQTGAALLFSSSANTATANSLQTNTSASTNSLGPNLIQNPSLETTDGNGQPVGWFRGGYGTNDRSYAFPAPAHTGTNGAGVTINTYTSGDAKWYFADVPVTAGATYQFSDYYVSNIGSEMDVRFKMSDNSYTYNRIALIGPSGSYQAAAAQFTAPANAVSATVFHLIAGAGTLTTDDYSLNAVTDTGGNFVPNGNFEVSGSNGDPYGWFRGGYGGNNRNFTYPTTGVGGSKGATVSITSYASGDAKWYFQPINLAAGFYTYSDEYSADLPSSLTLQIRHANGTYTYTDMASLPAASSFQSASVDFSVPSDAADMTVFHLIAGAGTLTIDNVSVTAAANKGGIWNTGAVTLTFDNGWLSQYQNAFPAMQADHLRGTFYIITHELSDYGYTGFMSKAQIADLYSAGNEIGSHTKTHPYLTQESAAAQWDEINGSRQELLAMNVGPINSFAYPYGDYDATTTALVEQAGYTNARSTITGYTFPDTDHYQLERQVMINTTTFADAKAWIDEAVADKKWLIIEFHQVDTSGSTYATAPALFGQIADYLAQTKTPVVTIDQGAQYLNP